MFEKPSYYHTTHWQDRESVKSICDKLNSIDEFYHYVDVKSPYGYCIEVYNSSDNYYLGHL